MSLKRTLATLVVLAGALGAVVGLAEAADPGDRPRVLRDLAYRDGPEADPKKHRLDLFLPEGKNWPTLIFVHGGGWTSGDKSGKLRRKPVYSEVGKFFAERGFGVAVINYRLQPDVDWRAQVQDVAGALAWVHRNISTYGGDPQALFGSGHSAGAQLVSRVTFDEAALKREGLPSDVVCGVVAISGAGYDLADESVQRRRYSRRMMKKRFSGGSKGDAWMREASTLPLIGSDPPPFLVMYAQRDPRTLREQSRLLAEALKRVGGRQELVELRGLGHIGEVTEFSQAGAQVTSEWLEFLRSTDCPSR